MMGKRRVQFNKERRVTESEPRADEAEQPAPRKLPPAAQRALAEAQARRAAAPAPADRPAEIGGPKGPEPTRYGDWEIKGRASDF
jgi:hypothetical protein